MKYCDDRMSGLKGTLHLLLTWLLAFAPAILGFMVQMIWMRSSSLNCKSTLGNWPIFSTIDYFLKIEMPAKVTFALKK